MLLLYVDDMLITGDDKEYIAFVKKRLSEQFLMSDLWLVKLRFTLHLHVVKASINAEGNARDRLVVICAK